MTKYCAITLLVLCMASTAFASARATGANATQSLLAVERQWIQAAETHDHATLARILDEDFTDISWRGQIRTRADLLHMQAAPASATQKLEDMKVRVYGNVGIVNGSNIITAKDHAWQTRVRFTDVFVRKDGAWRAVSAQETPVTTTGK